MNKLIEILKTIKNYGCCGIKISFEDEGALLNELITMRYLTATTGLELSIKIGGCEAKRDIVDCIDLECDSIVSPMIESNFALHKFLKSLDQYKYNKKKGFNLETINAYNNLVEFSTIYDQLDFVTVGRVDLISSLNKNRDFVDSDEMNDIVLKIFKNIKENSLNTSCYLGGAVSINSKGFIQKLYDEKLLDKFETRYIIFDAHKIDFDQFEQMLYLANVFEVEWLKYISNKYLLLSNKDIIRIKMIEDRISCNKLI